MTKCPRGCIGRGRPGAFENDALRNRIQGILADFCWLVIMRMLFRGICFYVGKVVLLRLILLMGYLLFLVGN